jgi:PKD repeat protein
MKTQKKVIARAMLGMVLSTQIILTPTTHAQVSLEYKPNYKFDVQRQKVEEIHRKASIMREGNNAIPTSYFSELSKNYAILFKYLPQTPENKTTFERCIYRADELAKEYTTNDFSLFTNGCLDPLDEMFKVIKNESTVSAKIIAWPAEGSAPLTVTFDGRSSTDKASDTTIPSKNYFWYYTDENGIEQEIGRGPLVKWTFKREGNYVVHLTVRSANNEKKWVFDGEASTNINVWPQAANLFVSVNKRRLREEIGTKFTSAEANNGLRIDGSASTPLGGRVIQNYERSLVNGSNEVMYKNGGKWAPWSFKVSLQANGSYFVTLKVQDNENNKVEKTYEIIISDPIAAIKVTPQEGNTTSIYNFDASTSYSVQSTLKTYQRTLSDENWNEITTEKTKSFQYKFTKPGVYRANLRVLDVLGNDNEESLTINVASTPPVPQFTYEPSNQWKFPSSFILDAGASYDIDTANDNDALSYERSFSNAENIVANPLDGGKRNEISMKEKGIYKVKLTVRDNYGKITETTKDINVESSLRPHLVINPVATQFGNATTFLAKSNDLIANYIREFGDGNKTQGTADRVVHTYKTVWTYTVKLTATKANGDTNEITTIAFVGAANSPIPGYTITNGKGESLIPEWTCKDPTGSNTPAYLVQRMQDITIDSQESVNIWGWKENLISYFKPQGGETAKKKSFMKKFENVGCHFIDMTIEDAAANKTSDARIWFQVSNAKPTLKNVVMTFPQAQGDYGIGIWQEANKNTIKSLDTTTLAIKIDAVNAQDDDGSIAKYKWFYYNVDDPTRLLEIKYTPASVPYIYFTLDRKPGEYRFGVEVFDNDGESTFSESSIGKGPVIFFPASEDNIDTPIVTLKVDKVQTKVGEQVRLETIAKTTSNRPDFATARTISYDFDGDGIYDVNTKDNVYTYVYKTTGIFTPRVKVTYRWKVWYAYGEKVNVEKGIKADFLYAIIDNVLLVRDTSYGDIVTRAFCTDALQCRTNSAAIIENQTYFKKEYAKPWKYVVDYKIQDNYGNASSKKAIIDIATIAPSETPSILTLPYPDKNGIVTVGKNLDNKILFFARSLKWNCYIDTDISKDATWEWKPDQNKDIECNQQALYEYKDPSIGSTVARVYFTDESWTTTHKDITISFLDNNIALEGNSLVLYEKIDGIIAGLWDALPDVKTTLLQLRNAIIAGDNTSSYVLQLKDILGQQQQNIDPATNEQLQNIITALSDTTVLSAIGGNDYEKARSAILGFIPSTRKTEVAKLFEEIDNANGNHALIKNNILKLFTIIDEEHSKKTIDDSDKEGITREICSIVVYYSIEGTSCIVPDESGTGSDNSDTPSTSTTTSWFSAILKYIGIGVGILGLGFVILVVIFAIKAKRKQQDA